MKKNLYLVIALAAITFQSCTKDAPSVEIDQEEVGGASITFTEVKAEAHGDHYHYHDIENGEVEEIKFSGKDMLPTEIGQHVHLEKGKTYRFQLKTQDFAGRESQQTFVERDDIHYAFILGTPPNTLRVEYADVKADQKKVKVGVTGYIEILDKSNTFVMNYILRHLNPGVKERIDLKNDWSNPEYQKYGGATDLDLKFEVHLVDADGHHH